MNTRKIFQLLVVVTISAFAQAAIAQAPGGHPSGSTGLCKDGTYYSGATKQGACRGHQGVKEWWGGTSAQAAKATAAAPAAAPAPAEKPAAAPASKPASSPAPAPMSATAKAPAPGGGAGKVWLNSATNVYHCQGSKYYGTTKQGTYMSEADAKAKGARPDHGKPCQ